MTAQPYIYPDGVRTDFEKQQFRKATRQGNCEDLFISTRNDEGDKLQFFTHDQEQWRKCIKKEFPNTPEEIVTYKYMTGDIGTILSYSTGEFVIHGSQDKRCRFEQWFQEQKKKTDPGKLSNQMKEMKI